LNSSIASTEGRKLNRVDQIVLDNDSAQSKLILVLSLAAREHRTALPNV
jgi:hypothetical protein